MEREGRVPDCLLVRVEKRDRRNKGSDFAWTHRGVCVCGGGGGGGVIKDRLMADKLIAVRIDRLNNPSTTG